MLYKGGPGGGSGTDFERFFHELYVTIFEITLVHIPYYWQLPGVPSCSNHLTHGLYPYLCDLGFTGLSINISGQNILLMVGTSSYKVNLHIESKAKKKEVSHKKNFFNFHCCFERL